jgi:hypothetical protein
VLWVALVVMRPLSLAAHLRGISLAYEQHSSVNSNKVKYIKIKWSIIMKRRIGIVNRAPQPR